LALCRIFFMCFLHSIFGIYFHLLFFFPPFHNLPFLFLFNIATYFLYALSSGLFRNFQIIFLFSPSQLHWFPTIFLSFLIVLFLLLISLSFPFIFFISYKIRTYLKNRAVVISYLNYLPSNGLWIFVSPTSTVTFISYNSITLFLRYFFSILSDYIFFHSERFHFDYLFFSILFKNKKYFLHH